MRLDLFSRGDSVLLLGEGNFSFAVCLVKHKLPIKITATCFECEAQLEHQQENIEYLKSNEVPVFLNVDATKLHTNVNFAGKKYSKIVFNFPHIGGKMKIHLNRQLLRGVFESCSEVIAENGAVIVSLCQGQGGTPCDHPQRRWEDSWQVTEMGAHGNFVLTAVEPFRRENFLDYKCVGYRSRDVTFNLAGALVHVFVKREPPETCLSEEALIGRLGLVPLEEGSETLVPHIYSRLYRANPLRNGQSCICFLKDLLTGLAPESEWRILNESMIPAHIQGDGGVPCEVRSEKHSLRVSALETLEWILQRTDEADMKGKLTLYPGMYFNPELEDFTKSSPISCQFIVFGRGVPALVDRLLNALITSFGATDSARVSRRSEGPKSAELVCGDADSGRSFVAARVYWKACEAAVVDAQRICEYFFKVGWREVWGEGHRVEAAGRPALKQISLHPSVYKFDLTLRFAEAYQESEVRRILWLAAGELLEGIETVNEYDSGNWSSKCYRLAYRSLDKPLHRSRAIAVHSRIVGRMLELGLDVAVG